VKTHRSIALAIVASASVNVSLAAPAVSSISGPATDNSVVTINGSGFGSNSLRVEWLGGTGGVIESGGDGETFRSLSRAGWSEDLAPGRFTTANVYSGRVSLAFDSAANGNDGRFGMHYDTGVQYAELYTSYMTYFDNRGVGSGQWKMMRWGHTNSLVDTSTPNTLMSNWWPSGDAYVVFNGTTQGAGEDISIWMNESPLPQAGAWYRVETMMRPATAAGRADGEVWVRVTRASDGVQTGYFRNANVTTYTPGETKRYRFVTFQNYQGNGFGTTGTRAYMDDIYISTTQARVEICEAAQWSACRKKEIQYPTAWADGRITVRLNKGARSSLTGAYLYVIDSTGAANANGIPLASVAPRAATSVTVN
jgi:hypothetical protein